MTKKKSLAACSNNRATAHPKAADFSSHLFRATPDFFNDPTVATVAALEIVRESLEARTNGAKNTLAPVPATWLLGAMFVVCEHALPLPENGQERSELPHANRESPRRHRRSILRSSALCSSTMFMESCPRYVRPSFARVPDSRSAARVLTSCMPPTRPAAYLLHPSHSGPVHRAAARPVYVIEPSPIAPRASRPDTT